MLREGGLHFVGIMREMGWGYFTGVWDGILVYLLVGY